ncbi:MAG: phosphopantothenoylcysteine decarboxylase [Phycisphaerales bacterium]|nr:phosphopantothenoylcysteine decarboxylase [Phycisphaerales bacterium]
MDNKPQNSSVTGTDGKTWPLDASPLKSHSGRRLLITAGPTYEPIDAVRFIGNRSSGRLGIALADEAARRGWRVTLLLGPTALAPTDSHLAIRRFRTTADLEGLLREEGSRCDVLIMAAAVADYRALNDEAGAHTKLRRTGERLVLELEPTPDLLAGFSATRRPDQFVVGFALEPRERLLVSARAKLGRKNLDFIVANPLETMDAPTIEATILGADGFERQTDGPLPKELFAPWLLELIEQSLRHRASASLTTGASHS